MPEKKDTSEKVPAPAQKNASREPVTLEQLMLEIEVLKQDIADIRRRMRTMHYLQLTRTVLFVIVIVAPIIVSAFVLPRYISQLFSQLDPQQAADIQYLLGNTQRENE